MIRAVVAYDQDRGIGRDGGLLWAHGEMRSDMKRFRDETMGYAVIMGRKTFESIGKPLPGRLNVVVSSSMQPIDGIELANSVDDAIERCTDVSTINIIGGEQIYKASLPRLDVVLATEVLHRFRNADTYFPELTGEWVIAESEGYDTDEDNKYPYRFVTYERQR